MVVEKLAPAFSLIADDAGVRRDSKSAQSFLTMARPKDPSVERAELFAGIVEQIQTAIRERLLMRLTAYSLLLVLCWIALWF